MYIFLALPQKFMNIRRLYWNWIFL